MSTSSPFPRLLERIRSAQPVRLLCYGASISEVGRTPNWYGGGTGADTHWGVQLGRRLHERFPKSSFEAVHFGIGGQNAYELLGRFDWMPKEIALVMIQVGTNDCGFHEIPPYATANAVRTLIEAVQYAHKSDLLLVGSAGDNPLAKVLSHVEETQFAMREVAIAKNVPIVPLREAILEATHNGRDWSHYHDGVEGVHPNDAGMTVWANAIYDALLKHLPL